MVGKCLVCGGNIVEDQLERNGLKCLQCARRVIPRAEKTVRRNLSQEEVDRLVSELRSSFARDVIRLIENHFEAGTKK